MGMCSSLETRTQTDALIGEKMHTEHSADRNIPKLLLLGTGNTGKSTFFRQFKMQFADGISLPEREIYRDTIRDQAVFYMRRLTELCLSKHSNLEEECESFMLPDAIHELISAKWTWDVYDQPELTEEIGVQISTLWKNERIQFLYRHEVARQELAVPSSCEFFWNDISRIADSDYWPTDQDCISAYNRTSGITKLNYSYGNQDCQIVDIGGQRSERRKWIHVFDNVDCLLYVVSLSAYDEILFEDRKMNAMTEQLNVFEETINRDCFASTTLIVFLNKKDLLEQKIVDKRPISLYFDDYNGDAGSFDSSVSHIRKKFKRLNKSEERKDKMFFHITCATDQENARKVLGDVTQMIVGKQLENQGFF